MATLCDEDYRRILQNNEKKITNLTNLNCLLPLLRQKGLLTDNEFRLLKEMPPYEVRSGSKLVDILLGKGGGDALNLFIQALEEEDEHLGHKNLAIMLRLESETSNIKTRPAKKPPPPIPYRKSKVKHNQADVPAQPFTTPQPIRKRPLLPPERSRRSQSVVEVDDVEKTSLVAICDCPSENQPSSHFKICHQF